MTSECNRHVCSQSGARKAGFFVEKAIRRKFSSLLAITQLPFLDKSTRYWCDFSSSFSAFMTVFTVIQYSYDFAGAYFSLD